ESVGYLNYNQLDHSFTLLVNGSGYYSSTQFFNYDGLIPKLDGALMSAIHSIDLDGGDVVVRRAWHNSQADNVTAFATDLQIADDYRLYLENAPLINAIMAAAPESAFTTGWALTLLKAEELGLNTGSENDFKGGFLTQLGDQIMPFLQWAPSF